MKLKLALILLKLLAWTAAASGQSFVVVSQTAHKARYLKVAEESYRAQSQLWFGKPHPQLWRPVQIVVDERPGGGGATTFALDRGQAFGWRMKCVGTPDQIATSVIPHEVCHVVMHAHFRRPLPRFFDEGIASMFETDADKAKHVATVLRIRPPPLKSGMDLTRYPASNNVRTFYAHSHVVTAYMLTVRPPETMIEFLADKRKPSEKIEQYYGLTPEQLDAAAMQFALKPASPSNGREVIAFSFSGCKPCEAVERDERAGRFKGFRLRWVKRGTAEFATQAAAYQRATGKPVTEFPTFWVAGTKEYTVGYSGPRSLVEWVVSIPAGLFRLVFGSGNVQIDTPGGSQTFATEDVSVDLFGSDDFTGVRVFLALHRRELGVVGGLAAGAAERAGSSAVERIVRDATKGRAAVIIVPERTQPKRYAAVMQAFGRTPGEDLVGIVVPKTNRGLLKGMAIKVGERIAKGKLKDAPIDVVFERADPNVVVAINAAQQVQEDVAPPPAPGPQGAPVETFKGELTSIVASVLKENLPKTPLPESIQNAVAEKAAERVVEKLPVSWIPNELLAILMGSGGIGYTLREFVKHRFDKKQESAKEKEIAVQEAKLSVLSQLASSLQNSSEPVPVQPAVQQPSSTAPVQSSASPAPSVPASNPNASVAAPTVSMTVA